MRRVWLIVLITFLFVVTVSTGGTHTGSGFHSTSSGFSEIPLSTTSSSYYNRTAAVDYGMLIFKNYAHTKYYPAGINESVMQKNLDQFGSEDCAHFVSE